MKSTGKKGPIAGEQEINVRGGSMDNQEEQLLDYLGLTKYLYSCPNYSAEFRLPMRW